MAEPEDTTPQGEPAPGEPTEPKGADWRASLPEEARSALDQEEKTWRGRTEKEQRRAQTAQAQLESRGFTLDDDGNIVPMPGSQYVQPQPPPTEPPPGEEDDWGEYSLLRKLVSDEVDRRTTTKVQEAMGVIAPVMEDGVEASCYRQYTDWNDIGPVVKKQLTVRGATLAQARQAGWLETMVNAARWERQQKNPPPDPNQEAERLRALAAQGAMGAGAAVIQVQTEFDESERAEMARRGEDPKVMKALREGPARIDVKGDR